MDRVEHVLVAVNLVNADSWGVLSIMIKKTKLIYLPILLFAFAVKASPNNQQRVLVVGSTRSFEPVDAAEIVEIIGHERGDYSYAKCFGDNAQVSSLDQDPARINKLPEGHQHVRINFLKFEGKPYDTLMFEWFPPAKEYSLKGLYEGYFSQMLEKASFLLKEGGELIIDHHPFMALIPSDDPKTARQMEEFIHEISRVNPFVLAFSTLTRETIMRRLESYVKTSSPPSLSSQFDKDVFKSLKLVSNQVFKKPPKQVAKLIIKKYKEDKSEEKQQSLFSLHEYMFLWSLQAIYLKEAMIAEIEKFGFYDTSLEFVQENPYNKRKNAWIFHAKRSSTKMFAHQEF
jgi:hypothetical protein